MPPESTDTAQTTGPLSRTEPGEPLASIYAEFNRLMEAGRTPDVDRFCAGHPEEIRSELLALCRDAVFLRQHLPSSLDIDDTPRSVLELGEFRLLQEIGRGGMGVVYLARQRSLDREVAVKVLLPHLTQTERQVKRFRREARSAARLQHKTIVPIHAIGQDGDTHYFAMEYVPGHSLAHELRAHHRRAPWDESACILPDFKSRDYITTVVELMAEVADAIEYGHSQGIVHRDIKPANILLDPSGRPHVVDFGLAKDDTAETISRPGELAGTIQYMSPEQTLAKRVPIDHRTDVFSLGIVLYELLGLERPFHGESHNDILYQISFREPRPVRKANPRVPMDLATICGKALAKSPDDRYAKAGELAEDLRRFLRHESILARPPSFLRRAGMFGRAHRMAVGIVVFAAVALAIGWIWGRWDTWQLRKHYAVWQAAMVEAGAPSIEPLELSVEGGDGASVKLHIVDPATSMAGEEILIGSTPIRAFPIDVAGLYRVVVESEDGFMEATRYLAPGSGSTTVVSTIRATEDVTSAGMVLIDGGTFTLDHDCGVHEGTVELAPYWIDEAEVSNREYREFVLATAHAWPFFWNAQTYDEAWDDLPVVGVSWFDAVAYSEWAGKRLPTHVEWERAGRGEVGRLYPWGDDPRSGEPLANLGGENPGIEPAERFQSYLSGVRPVRSDPQARTPEGLYHMLGNVSEFTESVHHQVRRDVAYTLWQQRVITGGAWWFPRKDRNLTIHTLAPTFLEQNYRGFRCAKSVDP